MVITMPAYAYGTLLLASLCKYNEAPTRAVRVYSTLVEEFYCRPLNTDHASQDGKQPACEINEWTHISILASNVPLQE